MDCIENIDALKEEIRQLKAELACCRTPGCSADEGNNKFSNVVAASPMGMHFYEWQENRGLVFVGSNPAAATLLGVDHSMFVGKTIDEAFPPLLETEIPRRYREAALEGKYWSTQQVNYDKDEIKGAFEVHAFQVSPGNVAAMFMDITKRILAEHELQKARNYISNIINSMPSVLVGVNESGAITQWNHGAERVTGKKAGEVLGQPLSHVNPLFAQELGHAADAMARRKPVHHARMRVNDSNEPIHEDVTIFPLVANGVSGAVIRIDDITEKIRLEELMIQSEKMLSVGGLAAGMAHEINNPIGGMMQNAQLLQQRVMTDIDANRKAAESVGISLTAIHRYHELRNIPIMVNAIIASGERAAVIVRNMLAFARKDTGEKRPCDPAALIETALELVRSDFDLKKKFDMKFFDVVRQFEPGLTIQCEPNKIAQVILNLLKNGAFAMAKKKESLSPDVSYTPCFTLRVKSLEDKVRIEIADNGVGIPQYLQNRIFEPFFTTRKVGEGTGLGLSVSYFIISQQHNGAMSFDSVEGVGTNFMLDLPAGQK